MNENYEPKNEREMRVARVAFAAGAIWAAQHRDEAVIPEARMRYPITKEVPRVVEVPNGPLGNRYYAALNGDGDVEFFRDANAHFPRRFRRVEGIHADEIRALADLLENPTTTVEE